jgi:adenosylcobinamide-GDP ribazoletransferase
MSDSKVAVQTRMKSKIVDHIARLCTALRFLSIMPVSWKGGSDADRFRESVPYFPFVGLIIGAVGYFCAQLFSLFCPQPVTAGLLVLYLGSSSGFLHLDGLADSADGLLSSRPREISLQIMKDSRVGAMGVIVIVMLLILKFSALSSIDPRNLATAAFLIPVAGRCSLLFCMGWLSYARKGEGIGALFYTDKAKRSGWGASAGFALLAFCTFPATAAAAVAAFFFVNLLFCGFCRRRIGGATGDTLGAACELTETAVAVAMTMMI